MKDIFTDILRHDLLNPVSAIKLVADVLLKSESDARKVDLLRSVQRSVAALIEMTESAARLASVTGSLALEFPEADPVSVLRSVLPDLKLKAAEKNITITDRSASSGFTARFNPLMKEVLANLLSNAIKYSPSGTEIELVVEDRGESWGLAVRDQGFGVPDEHKEKIFNRFERLEKQGVKGSGLGLAIAKQVVVLHGGEIWVEDNPPGGSLFLVKLPKAPKAARFAGPDQAVGGSALTETVD
jgi:signal transduction histidine kinase